MGTIDCVLNGRPAQLEAGDAGATLLDCLRARGLTGAKEGCAEGECGACTVLLVGDDDGRSAYRAVNSCLMLAPMAAHHEIYTVESLATGDRLSDAQQAMAAAGGSQCGYCTPGFVMSLFAEQHRRDRSGACDALAMAGNLCRCTGYRPIRDAAASLGPPAPGPFRDRLDQQPPRIGSLEGSSFSRPSSVEACIAILASDDGARLVAGGSDVVVESNLHDRHASRLVSVEAIDELREFSDTGERVRIGAGLPLTDIGLRWRNAPAALYEWLTLFASPPIRNRATLGGNLATASPIGDAAPLFAALDAVVHIAGPAGRRSEPLASFFTGYRQTVLRRGEMLTAIEVPKPLPAMVRFYKMTKRRLDDISTVAAGFAMHWDHSGRISRARFAFGGVAATPIRASEAEQAATGQPWNEETVARIQDVLGRTLRPMSDHRGSREYRLEVAKSLIEKFWYEREDRGAA